MEHFQFDEIIKNQYSLPLVEDLIHAVCSSPFDRLNKYRIFNRLVANDTY